MPEVWLDPTQAVLLFIVVVGLLFAAHHWTR